MHQEQVHQHISPRPHLPETPAELTRDWLARFLQPRGVTILVIAGLLVVAGIVGVYLRLSAGMNRAEWGFYAATVVFLFSTAQGAPILAVAARLTKGYWRKPLVRVAELFTITGLLSLVLFIPLLALLPPLEGRATFWVSWPGTPQIPLILAIIGLVVCGLGLLYASARPDLAAVRDLAPGGLTSLQARLAGKWGGSTRQWKVQSNAITYLGVSYLMMLVFVHFLISVELAITLVPGWRDPIFPAFHAISGLQAGLATLVLGLGFLRYFGGFKEYLALDQFWNPAKLLLAFSLLWFYFWWSGFIVFWYGRTPAEQGVLEVTIFGPYFVPFLLGLLCNFVLPLILLAYNPVRVSILGPILASCVILFGNFMDRVRIYGGSFLVESEGHIVEHVPATHLPQLADFLVFAGAIGGVVFIFVLATRIIPPIALWELKEGQLLTRTRTMHKAEVIVIGKPQ